MIDIDLRPVWRFRSGGESREFDFQLVAVLAGLERDGKLTQVTQRIAAVPA